MHGSSKKLCTQHTSICVFAGYQPYSVGNPVRHSIPFLCSTFLHTNTYPILPLCNRPVSGILRSWRPSDHFQQRCFSCPRQCHPLLGVVLISLIIEIVSRNIDHRNQFVRTTQCFPNKSTTVTRSKGYAKQQHQEEDEWISTLMFPVVQRIHAHEQ